MNHSEFPNSWPSMEQPKGTVFLDGRTYAFTDPEDLERQLEKDYPNEELPHWLAHTLRKIRREVKRREEHR